MSLSRRRALALLGSAGALAVAAPFVDVLGLKTGRAMRGAQADVGRFAKRAIFFYFPDGVAGASANGEPSAWHATGSEFQFNLPAQLDGLRALQQDCLFFTGLSSGPTDSGSHPGGAKKLLTGVDGGNGMSLDQYLARNTSFASSPWQHLYLGGMSVQNNASGDKHIVYPSAGQTIAPEDNPRRAFGRLFESGLVQVGNPSPSPAPNPSPNPAPATGPTQAEIQAKKRKSILDLVKLDVTNLRQKLGNTERVKLDLHLESLREVEVRNQRIIDAATVTPVPNPSPNPSPNPNPSPSPSPNPSPSPALPQQTLCANPTLQYGVADAALYDPANFPAILRAQIDVAVLAMQCGLTQVATIQCSHHTSELIMSRFPATEMYRDNFDMRSHQASHYGPAHDTQKQEYAHFLMQRRWFVEQFAYLLRSLKNTPDPTSDGMSMLDTSVVLLCSEISDGNTHSHDNLPFVLAGKASGAISTGRLLSYGYERHSKLLASIARACGAGINGFGDVGGNLSNVA